MKYISQRPSRSSFQHRREFVGFQRLHHSMILFGFQRLRRSMIVGFQRLRRSINRSVVYQRPRRSTFLLHLSGSAAQSFGRVSGAHLSGYAAQSVNQRLRRSIIQLVK
jgi:hypothetical protein